MDSAKQQAVFNQYIHQYTPLIHVTLEVLRMNQGKLKIPYAQFLFSVIDYFGLLYRVADKSQYNKILKDNFLEFFSSNYFPIDVRCKSDLIYFVRNGVMHQIFAKALGIGYQNAGTLFYRSTSGTPILNLKYLDKITMKAVDDFVNDLKTNDVYIDNLHDLLIKNNYGFNDHAELKTIVGHSFGGDMSKIIANCV